MGEILVQRVCVSCGEKYELNTIAYADCTLKELQDEEFECSDCILERGRFEAEKDAVDDS